MLECGVGVAITNGEINGSQEAPITKYLVTEDLSNFNLEDESGLFILEK